MKQTVVITGANRGIGLELVREYLRRGCEVIGLCRETSAELDASGARVIDGVDVADAPSAQTAARKLKGVAVDILINNAGIFEDDRLGRLDYQMLQRQFEVNALGPLHITEALLDNLGKGSKIALITSRMGSIADNGSGGYYGYRMSKAALNAAGKSLAVDLRGRGIAVAILHPGFVQTRMVDFAGDIPPATAAKRLAQRIDEIDLKTTGSFRHSSGEALPW
ncbi:MAG TPA: SDR family oxidoreductase [Gammaproteobacteria bacterium]|nr:SDR family oxidoreductase [Gammaproteobacteria bacterium]